ncbi:MAG: ATP-binding protein [Cyanothece sp. SIO1E1]|nr:ATP-binding protein [Cyanothece sp. SIO1E1]
MNEIFGDFIENLPPDHDSLSLCFSASSLPIQQRWRNNRLSAYFAADYLSTFLSANDDSNGKQKNEKIQGMVSYIANELLENAMKYSNNEVAYPIQFAIHLVEDPGMNLVFLVTNSITAQAMNKLKAFIQVLEISDPNELYIHQLEKNAVDENGHASGLGILTMINDYAAKLSWRFEMTSADAEVIVVTTRVQVKI